MDIMNKRFFRNTTNTRVEIYDISATAEPGEVISLINSQIEKSANLAHFVSKGILTEVEEATPPLKFKAAGRADVVLAPGRPGIDAERRIVIDGATNITPNTGSTLIQKGNFPGEGTETSVEKVIADGVQNIQDNMNKAAAAVPPAEPKEPVKPIPDNLKTWFTHSLNTKKSQILRYNDIAFLRYVSDYDKDVKVQKLLSQRIKELVGVDEEAVQAKMQEMGIGQPKETEKENTNGTN